MIVLATNKLIMRSKLPNNALFWFWSHDRFVSHKNNHEIETLKSIIRQFRPHENRRNQEIKSIIRNFNLMINNLISWKSWILISWNSTSWPWALWNVSYHWFHMLLSRIWFPRVGRRWECLEIGTNSRRTEKSFDISNSRNVLRFLYTILVKKTLSDLATTAQKWI